jgi:hypothetical protein
MPDANAGATLSAMSGELTTQAVYVAAAAVAMVTAGLGRRKLEWRPRPRHRKRWWREQKWL